MVPYDAARQNDRGARQTPAATTILVGQLAHELNSLLDGSLRLVALALRQLQPVGEVPDTTLEAVAGKLRMVQDAMGRMAVVLERAMRPDNRLSQVLAGSPSMNAEVGQILGLVAPLADAHGVRVTAEVGPEAGGLPSGPLGTVLLNGLRNAIQACQGADGETPQVELRITVGSGERLVIEISDTGPGPRGNARPGGHGLGLDLCRRIVADLAGRLELTGRGTRPGVILTVEIPLRELTLS